MYIPGHFKWKDTEQVLEFIRQYPFGQLVSGGQQPLVTHLPFVARKEGEELVLVSHMARENPQWQHLQDQNVLVVFQHPHAYISPSWYSHTVNVPTWNYLAVHCYGTIELIDDRAGAESIMYEMFEAYDPTYIEQYRALPENYTEKLYRGVVAFKIGVTDMQAKAKVSQNKPAEDRLNVIAQLEKPGDAGNTDLAMWMKKIYQL